MKLVTDELLLSGSAFSTTAIHEYPQAQHKLIGVSTMTITGLSGLSSQGLPQPRPISSVRSLILRRWTVLTFYLNPVICQFGQKLGD